MKKQLSREFETKYNSAMVHSQLIKRKRLQSETPRQYIYAMQTVAGQGIVEEEALIQYIIDGIPDEECNKSILYGSDNVTQLRKNLEHYDRMKERIDNKLRKEHAKNGKKKTTEKGEKKGSKKESKEARCFICGLTDYMAKNFPHREEGPKCFKCNRFGHIATKCSTASETVKKDRKVNVVNVSSCTPTNDEMVITVNDVPMLSMMDTETYLTLLRFSEYLRIGSPVIRPVSHSLYGLGKSQMKPIGVF